jgi:hypothetical protein
MAEINRFTAFLAGMAANHGFSRTMGGGILKFLPKEFVFWLSGQG